MPGNGAVVGWSEANFDRTYQAPWWPADIPVLRLAGVADRIVWQGWRQERFRTPNRIDCEVPGAGHFPWIENPAAVTAAFALLARNVPARLPGRQSRAGGGRKASGSE